MEREHKALRTFLERTYRSARPTGEPVAHLQFHERATGADVSLLRLERDDVLAALDTSSVLVQKLLEQMRTYDPATQVIVGLVFDRPERRPERPRVVLSEVLRCDVPPAE